MPAMVIDARAADLGGGLTVRRILPFHRRRMVGPFIFMDHAGPVRVLPEQRRAADVRPHPHIGLATVSYLFSGQITHRDSLGVEQVIRPGEVNWMTAGRGISHSERFEDPAARAAAAVELIQTWVALPDADEEIAPGFEHYAPEVLPVVEERGRWLRLIAGTAYGLRNEVKTRSPLFYLHA
ncbi:MAG: pirin family protein, partial [Acetobacteraceae bacterium]